MSYEEKRQFRRYVVDFGGLGLFPRDKSVLPGLIVDISMGGCAFFYQEKEDWPENGDEVYTLFGDLVSIEEVPVESVIDLAVTDKAHDVYQMLVARNPEGGAVRRRGVKFGALNEDQLARLKALIQEFDDFWQRREKKKSTPG